MIAALSVISCASQEVTSVDAEKTGRSGETYLIDISMEGGSGKAFIKSPVEVTETDGRLTAKLVWSSRNYDYMIVDGVRYENENDGGESTFTVDIDNTTEPLTVIGDTVAMSTPHEIEYVITWGKRTDGLRETADSESTDNTDKEAGSADKDPGSSEKESGNTGKGSRDTGHAAVRKALEKAGLTYSGACDLKYAEGFMIEKYGDYDYVSITDSGDYLVVPESQAVPKGIPETVVVLQKPLDKTYLVSTSAMDLINACGALDMIRLSGTKADEWYVDAAREAMESGQILYAGKYRAPDYERILESGCNFAVENTMIYHEPAIKTKLEELGIPVLVETSSYEKHPLGRLEWIKLYGVLFDRESEAEDFFESQLASIEPLLRERPDTGMTAAFFHVTANGLINVRKPGDYITRMIELAGGHYVPGGIGDGENALSTMNMQMEDFYEEASRADIIIYNSTIGGEISSIDELVAKNALFKDFKAVKESGVYCTEKNLFQQITGMAEFMRDLNDVFAGTDREYTYLNKLN